MVSKVTCAGYCVNARRCHRSGTRVTEIFCNFVSPARNTPLRVHVEERRFSVLEEQRRLEPLKSGRASKGT
jgi:hypothetical protein